MRTPRTEHCVYTAGAQRPPPGSQWEWDAKPSAGCDAFRAASGCPPMQHDVRKGEGPGPHNPNGSVLSQLLRRGHNSMRRSAHARASPAEARVARPEVTSSPGLATVTRVTWRREPGVKAEAAPAPLPHGTGWPREGLAASARALLRVFITLSGVRGWLYRARCRLKAAVLPRASLSRELSRTPVSPQLPGPAEASWRLVRLSCRGSSSTRP